MANPAEDGLFMPPDWAPHARCWMAWPSRPATWRDNMVDAWRATAQLARAIQRFEPVTMLLRSEHLAEATLLCGRGIRMRPIELDDCWIRDSGPSFLTDGQEGERAGVAGVAWDFNGWGSRAVPHARDDKLGRLLLEAEKMHAYRGPMVLEGGAIQVDGAGTLIACESCLLNENRNPTLDRREVEEILALHLGARRIVWLGEGLVDDPTDGHADNLACFAGPGTVLAMTTEDPADGNYRALRDNLQRLRLARGSFGRSLEVIEVPQPAAREWNGRRVPLSYTNLYIANGAVIMPGFGDPQDEAARAVIAVAFPNREVVQLDMRDLVRGGRGLHGIALGQPLGRALA